MFSFPKTFLQNFPPKLITFLWVTTTLKTVPLLILSDQRSEISQNAFSLLPLRFQKSILYFLELEYFAYLLYFSGYMA